MDIAKVLTDTAIAAGVAMFFSYVLEVIPGANTWWADKVPKKYKPLIVLIACVVVPFAIVGLACFGIDIGYGEVCPDPGDPMLWIKAAWLALSAFLSSQWTFVYGSSTLGERLAAIEAQSAAVVVEGQAVETPKNPTPVEKTARSDA